MDILTLGAIYRLTGELFLYPEERDRRAITEGRAALGRAPPAIRDSLEAFLAAPVSCSSEEYVATIELAPPCPLYLGAYLFDEPSTCLGAGMSGRNAYMVELINLYHHFALELGGGELADYLPVMVEFASLSLERGEHDEIGLRRRYVEHYLYPGLAAMLDRFRQYESIYALLLEALVAAVEADRARMADAPMWTPSIEDMWPKRPPLPARPG